MKTKHTPGKWEQRKTFDTPILVLQETKEWYYNSISICGNDSRRICSVDYMTDTEDQGFGNNNTIELFEANAKLIVAAPDLLEALIKMCEYHEKMQTFDKGDNGYYSAKAAIKKATE